MGREIRITVDDDEVFERMRARKRDLDLTWEEVLQRGLRRGEEGSSRSEVSEPPGSPHAPGFGEEGRYRETHEAHVRGDSGEKGVIGDFADQMRREIQHQVRSSLESSFDHADREIDREMRDLQHAEDAVLRFPVLDGGRRYAVPLRVNLQTSRGGLDVEVVAVRQGKSVADTNRFDRAARRTLNEHLARKGTATLAFGANGEQEAYTVAPVLTWSHREDGTPTVSEVAIDEVLFDDEA